MLTSDLDPHSARGASIRTRSDELPKSLRYFLFLLLVLTILSLAFSLLARRLGAGLPYTFPGFFNPRSFLADFFEFRVRFYDFGHPGFFTQRSNFMYPPAMALPLEAFYATSHPFWIFTIFLAISGVFFTFCFFRVLRHRGLSVLSSSLLALGIAITSHPYMHLVERGNTEIFVWITVTLGIWAFYRGRFSWAAVCFGIATALKLYPFIFFGLFLPRRRYREILLGGFITLALTLIALRALSPNVAFAFAWDKMQLEAFGKYYAAYPWWIGYDHSFFALVKLVSLPWHPDLTPLVRTYTWFVALGCLTLYFTRIWRLPMVNQILALSVLTVSIAPVSYDYTLLSLYGSLAILCVIALRLPDDAQQKLMPYFILFALILTPESYVTFHGIRFAGELRAICLIALLALAICRPIRADNDIGQLRPSNA